MPAPGPTATVDPTTAPRTAAALEPAAAPAPPLAGAAPGRPSLAWSIGALLVVVGFVVGARPLADNSFLTHLATGRIILERGAVPDADLYSWTAAGTPWVVQSWLASVVYAALEQTAGLAAVRFLHGALAAVVVAALWALTAPVRALPTRVALVGAPLGVGTLLWSPRPLLFGLAALSLVLVVLAGRASPRWLLPTFAVWAATHGSFPLGLAIIGAVAVGVAVDHRRPPRRELAALAWAAVGTVSIVAGPLGLDGLWFPVRLLARQEVLGEVREWQPPTYTTPAEWLYVALVVAVLAVLARRGRRLRSLLPAALAVVLGLLAIRNLTIASVVLVAAVAPCLAPRGRRGVDPAQRGPLARAIAAVAAVVAVVAVASVATAAPLDLSTYPEASLDRLEAQGLLGDPAVRLLTHDVVAASVELRVGERAGIFLDDRVDMFPAEVVRDYVALLDGGDHGALLARWRPDVVLWRADSELGRWLSADDTYDRISADDGFVLWCRVDSPVRARCG